MLFHALLGVGIAAPVGRRRARAAAWIALSLLARPVAADEPAAGGEAKIEEARQHFERGLDLSDAKSWDEALAEFLLSKKIYPKFRVDAGLDPRDRSRFASRSGVSARSDSPAIASTMAPEIEAKMREIADRGPGDAKFRFIRAARRPSISASACAR